jgi:hypothetical protein
LESSTLTVIVLLLLVGLRWALLAVGVALLVRPVSSCPACTAASTLGLHRPWLRWIVSWLEWRWCPQCGWQGPARRVSARERVGIPHRAGHESRR